MEARVFLDRPCVHEIRSRFHPSCALSQALVLTTDVDAVRFADTSIEELGERSELYHQPAKRKDPPLVEEGMMPGELLLEAVFVCDHVTAVCNHPIIPDRGWPDISHIDLCFDTGKKSGRPTYAFMFFFARLSQPTAVLASCKLHK